MDPHNAIISHSDIDCNKTGISVHLSESDL